MGHSLVPLALIRSRTIASARMRVAGVILDQSSFIATTSATTRSSTFLRFRRKIVIVAMAQGLLWGRQPRADTYVSSMCQTRH